MSLSNEKEIQVSPLVILEVIFSTLRSIDNLLKCGWLKTKKVLKGLILNVDLPTVFKVHIWAS